MIRCLNMKPWSRFIPFKDKERQRKTIREQVENIECSLLFRAWKKLPLAYRRVQSVIPGFDLNNYTQQMCLWVDSLIRRNHIFIESIHGYSLSSSTNEYYFTIFTMSSEITDSSEVSYKVKCNSLFDFRPLIFLNGVSFMVPPCCMIQFWNHSSVPWSLVNVALFD